MGDVACGLDAYFHAKSKGANSLTVAMRTLFIVASKTTKR